MNYQLCPPLCNPLGYSLPGSSSKEFYRQVILEWVAISFSRGSSWPRNWTHVFYVSCIGAISLHNLKLEECYLGWKQKESFLCQFMTLVAEIPISPRNALEGFDKADGTLDSQVMSFHNLVHSFLNGTSALPHSAANDPVFVVCSKTQTRWKMF